VSSLWNWPGARWWKVDLHAHTPGSYDFEPEEDRSRPDWQRWVESARDAGLGAIAVTDHNTAVAISAIQQAARLVSDGPAIFPGVEVTASCGTHLLVLFDPRCSQEMVEDFLSQALIPVEERGTRPARSRLNVENLLDLTHGAPRILVAAHANGEHGILSHEGEQRLAELKRPALAAAEVDPGEPLEIRWLDGSLPEVGRPIPMLWGSDGHRFQQLGRRFTWVKMTRPDLEGLALALLDGQGSSLRLPDGGSPADPNAHAALVIERLQVRDARYLGRSEAFNVDFNPWMNALVGGRGTGKSTLVDFLRKTLRREGELDAVSNREVSLREVFDARLSVQGSQRAEGLLTNDSVLGVIYRKDGERFQVSWDAPGRLPVIQRFTEAGLVAEPGEVRERFPVRIYSQKQLYELAQKPNALLAIFDESPQVAGVQSLRQLDEAGRRYLALRAEARAARARAAELPDRQAARADLHRKLEVLQSGGNAQALSAFRLRRQQDSTWRTILQGAGSDLDAVATAVEALVVPDFGPSPGDPADGALQTLGRMRGRLCEVVETLRSRIQQAVDEARRDLQDLASNQDAREWSALLARCEAAAQAASQRLTESGLAGPEAYRELMDRAAALDREVQTLQEEEERAQALALQAQEALATRRQVRADLTERRRRFALDSSGDRLQLVVRSHGDRSPEVLQEALREILGISRFGEQQFEKLVAHLESDQEAPWSWRPLDDLVENLRRLQEDPEATLPDLGGRLVSALRRLPPESMDRLALYSPQDSVEVRFRDPRQPKAPWKPLAQGSPGQQTAALLAFVLGYGDEPIVLDQPEDDLDSTLIYDLVVQRLREIKATRQVIVVTHNANIVVHGDAELVISLAAHNDQTRIACQGGLQEQKVRDEVCRVLEGGRKAFEDRYRRILSDWRAK